MIRQQLLAADWLLLDIPCLLMATFLRTGPLLAAGWWQFSDLNKNYWLGIGRGVADAQRRAFQNDIINW